MQLATQAAASRSASARRTSPLTGLLRSKASTHRRISDGLAHNWTPTGRSMQNFDRRRLVSPLAPLAFRSSPTLTFAKANSARNRVVGYFEFTCTFSKPEYATLPRQIIPNKKQV